MQKIPEEVFYFVKNGNFPPGETSIRSMEDGVKILTFSVSIDGDVIKIKSLYKIFEKITKNSDILKKKKCNDFEFEFSYKINFRTVKKSFLYKNILTNRIERFKYE